MQKVIFACVHNAGRSQMAAAFFNQLADHTKAEAYLRERSRDCVCILRSCPLCRRLGSTSATRSLRN
jgi:hypothetical protein